MCPRLSTARREKSSQMTREKIQIFDSLYKRVEQRARPFILATQLCRRRIAHGLAAPIEPPVLDHEDRIEYHGGEAEAALSGVAQDGTPLVSARRVEQQLPEGEAAASVSLHRVNQSI